MWIGAVVLCVARLAWASPPKREVVELDDGTRVEGKLVEYVDHDHVTLELDSGELRRLDWLDIRSVTDATPPTSPGTVTLKDGTVLYGDLVESAVGDHVSIRLPDGEIRRVTWDLVAGVTMGTPTTSAPSSAPSPSSSTEPAPANGNGAAPVLPFALAAPPRAHRIAVSAIGGYEAGSADRFGVGGSIYYFLTDVLAVGVNARGFVDRPSSLSSPAHEDDWMTDIEFSYSVLRRATVDIYLVCGISVISTRPVALVDPSRTFGDELKSAPVLGVGNRLFGGRAWALDAEIRDVLFDSDVENPSVGPKPTGAPHLVNDLEFGIAATLWFPMGD